MRQFKENYNYVISKEHNYWNNKDKSKYFYRIFLESEPLNLANIQTLPIRMQKERNGLVKRFIESIQTNHM